MAAWHWAACGFWFAVAACGQPPETKPPLAPAEAARIAEIVRGAAARGSATRGAAVFASAKHACVTCHKLGASGGAVGPELTQVGTCLSPAQIVESILLPERELKPEFSATIVETNDGQRVQGFKRRETATELALFDPAAQRERVLAKAEIAQRRDGVSLMPANLAAGLSTEELQDLVRFLAECKGQTGAAILAHAHVPATFPWRREPLDPQSRPAWQLPVNRERVYDFYAKEADYFRTAAPRPMLLPEFPGLDGAAAGHWGNQNEAAWRDDRWNRTVLDTVQAGVLRIGARSWPRAVCVRLGERGEMACCFDPDTLSYPHSWSGGLVRFSDVRHGIMDAIFPAGTPQPGLPAAPHAEPVRYRGYYRHGNRTIFAYRVGAVDWLDAPWVENGRFVRSAGPAATHPLRHLAAGGPARWPQRFPAKLERGRGTPYAVDTLPLPFDNPWKALLFPGGHDFLPDGSAVVGMVHGDVWQATGWDDPAGAVWRRIATGLNQPLGVCVADGYALVLGRDQITRLHDLNGDGEIDFHECFSNAFVSSPAGHDYLCGVERDAKGNFWFASGNQGLVRVSPDGMKAEVVAAGFRNPDGLAPTPDGGAVVPASEGEWTPASMLCWAKPGGHYGYRGPRNGQSPDLPMLYLPRGADNNGGGQAFVPDARWGAPPGSLVHLSYGAGTAFLVLRDEVDGQLQAAAAPLLGEFLSGAHRARFDPRDGQLWVSGCSGWGTYTPLDGCFQRLRWTGSSTRLPTAVECCRNGVRIAFAEPLPASAAVAAAHFAQAWNYRYSAAYGSPEFSPSRPGTVGHDVWEIVGAHLAADRKSLFLEIPDIQPVNQLHLRLEVAPGVRQDVFATAHRLRPDFAAYPGYASRPKAVAPHPILADMRRLNNAKPNPWGAARPKSRRIDVAAGLNLKFQPAALRAKAGERLEVRFANPDVVPHNWALLMPGSLARVGALADRLISSPDAADRHYVPESGEVIAHTDIVFPGDRQSIFLDAPAAPGRYPFLCTFPGHWMVMNGELVVDP